MSNYYAGMKAAKDNKVMSNEDNKLLDSLVNQLFIRFYSLKYSNEI